MSRGQLFLALAPYALVAAGLAAACLRAPETAWLPVIAAGTALINPKGGPPPAR